MVGARNSEIVGIANHRACVRRKHRYIAARWLQPKAVDNYTPILDRGAIDTIRCLLAEGQNGSVLGNPQPHAGRYSLNNILTIAFGTRTTSVNDPLVRKALGLR